ncbi:MAG: ribonuclease H-like domain-containing protein [Candidatus Pseudobacter hemicellulosilyticus]|uniref:Ribonuclease H-like domain-containing protein n=1 Tax=Candidatus Pseudobacter hemicellulosilyticus TaxID=3121375 RepID=A0AAJ5WUN1_9BACT|nr:MAG: ribonuclease H-like domain-containing protein [Pseudobacter sp.]
MIPLNNILFLDIETVPLYASYDQVPEEWKELWALKSAYLLRNNEMETVETIYNRAGIYSEFGKIVCISVGIVQGNSDNKKLVLKSFTGHDEKELLQDFCDMLKRWATDSNKYLCAHNGKEFDFPFLCRRLIINQLRIPHILNSSGKKPWEVNFLDTMELWKFGDYKNYTSLNLLARTLDIPTPKDDIDGKMVGDVYWREKDLQRIATYCQKDVQTITQIYLRLYGEPLIAPENIDIKN